MTSTPWVKETNFGIWFLNTYTWRERVLKRAISDLVTLLPQSGQSFPAILDVGCGRGHSLKILDEIFQPQQISAVEIDATLLPDARQNAQDCHCQIQLIQGSATCLPYPDHSFDMVFCHQSFHHIVHQEQAMQEFYRVLKEGGVLQFAETCKRYIYSLPIRLLFRHPMAAQKSAEGYLQLIRSSGFTVTQESISTPYLWWSRPDLGALEWLGFKVPEQRVETLLNLVAVKISKHS